MIRKMMLSAALALAALSMNFTADAASFGRSSSASVSSSRSSSFSAPRATPTATKSSSFSGGNSVGMTRPSAVAKATPPTPALTAPRPSAGTVTPTTTVINTHSGGSSGGSTFLSSMGGSFLGSYLGSSMGSRPVVAAAPMVAAAPAQGYAEAPVVMVAPASSSGLGIFATFLLMGAFFAMLYFAWKRLPMRLVAVARAEPTIPFAPVAFFVKLQTAFTQGDAATLIDLLGPNMRHMALPADAKFDGAARMTLSGISYEVIESHESVISVRFRYIDDADYTFGHELWHFIPSGAGWIVDGIEQL